jgi:hypothetical protein
MKGMDARLIAHLCSIDVAVVEPNIIDVSRGKRRVVVFSVYFPHDEEGPPPPESNWWSSAKKSSFP